MRRWAVQDAKSRFSELLDACMTQGPQIVTKHGEEAAVLIPMQDWKRLEEVARPSLKSLLLSKTPTAEIEIPKRGRARRRPVPRF